MKTLTICFTILACVTIVSIYKTSTPVIEVHSPNNIGNNCKPVELLVIVNGQGEKHNVEICN